MAVKGGVEMNSIIAVNSILGPVAFSLFILGVGYRLLRYSFLIGTVNRPMARNTLTLDSPPTIGLGSSYLRVITGPIRNFANKANRIWTLGYISYHIGIITIMTGYGVSMFILASRVMQGGSVPDVIAGLTGSYNYTFTNLMTIVFGNAEPLQAAYLFGVHAGTFTALTWVAVIAALIGNSMLLLNHLLGRSGAVTKGMDKATEHIRTKGFHNKTNLFITLLVFAIVWSEILARLQIAEGIVFVHSLLGLTLLAVFPFTILNHILYVWAGLYYAAKTQRYWGVNAPAGKNRTMVRECAGTTFPRRPLMARDICPVCNNLVSKAS